MDFFEEERKKRHLVTLQLAPLIDIFVLIIVFLIKGTVFGGVSVVIPNGLVAPTSSSKESMEVAPQVYVYEKQIVFKMIEKTISKSDFLDQNNLGPQTNIKNEIKKYIANLTPEMKKHDGTILNIIADAATPYNELFPIVKFIRECGYESLLFIAEGEMK